MSSYNNPNIICPNCENEFSSENNYCPNCGQANKAHRLNFKYIVSDFLSANFSLDSKILITLKLLLISPATLTVEFLSGKRMKYISPVRLYLLISFVYFFMLSIDPFNEEKPFESDNVVFSDSTDSIIENEMYGEYLNDSLEQESNEDEYLEKALISKTRILKTEAGSIVFKQLLKKYTSIGMFILIPLTALLFFILFYKGTFYIQHLIFSIHLQSVIFILFIIFNIIEWIVDSEVFFYLEWSLFILILYIWIKKYYKRSYLKTAWKLFQFLNGYLILFIFFFTVVLLLSFINLN